jgi:polysaccharide deacetylase 2 family uncharacterized protein YibQ
MIAAGAGVAFGALVLGAVVNGTLFSGGPRGASQSFVVAAGPDAAPLPNVSEREEAIDLDPHPDADRPQRRHLARDFRTARLDEGAVRRLAPLESGEDATATVLSRPPEAKTSSRTSVQDPVPPTPDGNRVPAPARAMIAIVIDDAGPDRERLRRLINGPLRPLTIAFLPYASDLSAQVAAARRAGHDVMLHLPMEPSDPRENPGPNAIMTGLSADELAWRLAWNFSRLDGLDYVAVNNHMGSRATADPGVVTRLMTEVKVRGLFFLDSRTSPRSIGAQVAAEMDVPNARRDVFLDNFFTVAAVTEQLALTEDVARRQGFAVAIGHVQPWTLTALERWAPTLESKGISLVGIGTLVRETNRTKGVASLRSPSALPAGEVERP